MYPIYSLISADIQILHSEYFEYLAFYCRRPHIHHHPPVTLSSFFPSLPFSTICHHLHHHLHHLLFNLSSSPSPSTQSVIISIIFPTSCHHLHHLPHKDHEFSTSSSSSPPEYSFKKIIHFFKIPNIQSKKYYFF